MTCYEYLNGLKDYYSLVRTLSDKNGALVALLKHKGTGKKLVVRKYPHFIEAYDFLKEISFESLPLIYDAVHFDDGQLVFEEYIDGITVADVIENGHYTYAGAKNVITEVCNALSLLHANGFIHRDIKPENIMINNGGQVKLIDFNASRKISLYAQKDTVQIGTIGYAPPEQLGIAQSNTQTDIYALGVLLNVMLTGVHPSKELAKGRAGKIVLKCTQIDPKSRIQSVNKLLSII